MDYSILARSYDLRGIYGVDIDDDFYYRLGYAFAVVTNKKRIALGYDARISSPSLKTAFTEWATDAGATIIDIGLCSSDMLSFATCHYHDIEAWVMITASHNPKEYNGMKSLNHKWEPYNLKKYGPDMVKIMDSIDAWIVNTVPKWTQETRDVTDAWVDHILDFVGRDIDFSSYTIVADWGNGSAGAFMTRLAERAGFKMIPLYLDPDGNFPYHHPNPMLEKNRLDAKNALLENHADLAFIFDGDADRVMVLDDTGELMTSGIISSIIARVMITQFPGAGFVGNATISHIYRDTVLSLWGTYEPEMVGHVYIREHMMRDPSIVYAWEHSAHYFFRDNYYMDSGIMAAMVILATLAKEGKKLQEVKQEYQDYITLEETNFEVTDPKWAIAKLTEIYASENQDHLDGLTVSYPDGSWYNFRPSSNEPLLRLNMEACSEERFDSLYSEIMGHIQTFGKTSTH
jgi:phosphomannomutase